MGQYTHYIIDVDISQELAKILPRLIDWKNPPKTDLPDHPFFKLEEWMSFLCGHYDFSWKDSGATHFESGTSDSGTSAIIEKEKNNYHLKIASCKRAHLDQTHFEHFLDFISPYVIAKEGQIIGAREYDDVGEETRYDLVKYSNKTLFLEEHVLVEISNGYYGPDETEDKVTTSILQIPSRVNTINKLDKL